MSRRPLTIMNLLSGGGMGGADILALDISKALKKNGHAVIFGCPGDNALAPAAEAAGLRLFILDRQEITDFDALGSFIRFCRDEKVDIINAHHSRGRHFLAAARYLGLKSKTVFTRHCLCGGLPLLGLFLHNFAADLNIAVSRAVRKSLLVGGMLPGRVKTVYGGIDIERFENVPQALVEEARGKYARPGVFNIGIVGRFQEASLRTDKPSMKRHEVLFRALAGLKMDFNLLVLGPSDRRSLEIMMDLARYHGLDGEKITPCGFQADPSPFYKLMDINVLPSPREGLGLALIEAMAAGVPCIGADGGGIREIITDGRDGFLIRPGDSRQLAGKIGLLLNDAGLRAAFIEAGRKKARELFDIRENVGLLEDAFYGILPAR
ncbi:MAG: glycosyltransferase family 4 protein [Nitrospiraceae bacterium]|nr:glycosyltransferase family 4 protein [Nitrospiraceae bacterium]